MLGYLARYPIAPNRPQGAPYSFAEAQLTVTKSAVDLGIPKPRAKALTLV